MKLLDFHNRNHFLKCIAFYRQNTLIEQSLMVQVAAKILNDYYWQYANCKVLPSIVGSGSKFLVSKAYPEQASYYVVTALYVGYICDWICKKIPFPHILLGSKKVAKALIRLFMHLKTQLNCSIVNCCIVTKEQKLISSDNSPLENDTYSSRDSLTL